MLNSEIFSLEELAEYLEDILNGPFSIYEENGELVLLKIKQLVDTVRGMRIEIYPREHAPPHFHVRSSRVDASFRTDNCEVLKGTISSRDYKIILYWFKDAKPILIKHWNMSRPTICSVGKFQNS